MLVHYNGHGVPRPSTNGEIWVFNKNYTQYIPLSIYELQSWVGSPSICVFDCNCAGMVVDWYARFAEQRLKEQKDPTAHEYILLGACGEGEMLPLNPDYPADIFTSCLTTPIRMALLWFCNHSRLLHRVPSSVAESLPGTPNNRKTPLGELNWIFTTITDTIAWNVLPREMFQKLFRQDLLVATLFRNFLLAERIMRSLNCLPVSNPKLPPTFKHPLWEAWDLAVDMCLAQLPRLAADPAAEYAPSSFFSEQLTAFEVWLEFGSEDKSPPEQLPIVLQVLLSQTHRLRALLLLSRFLDLGSWAVVQALSVGIFPYVLKLLASPAPELREVLVFIWTKILVLDRTCQADLLKENGHNYFVGILSTPALPSPELRIMSAFVLTVIMDGCRPGQEACLSVSLMPLCLRLLGDGDSLLRRWAALCVAKLWENMDEAKWVAAQSNAPERLYALLEDPSPEVRAAAVYALGTFICSTPRPSGAGDSRGNLELNTCLRVFLATTDASPIVRREAIITMSRLVSGHFNSFAAAIREAIPEHGDSAAPVLISSSSSGQPAPPASGGTPARVKGPPTPAASPASAPAPSASASSMAPADSSLASPGGSIYSFLWKAATSMSADPTPEVSALADKLVRSVNKKLARLEAEAAAAARAGGSWSSPAKKDSPGATFALQRKRPEQLQIPMSSPPPSSSSTGAPAPPASGPAAAAAVAGGTAAEAPEDAVALRSDFYEWSCEYWHGALLNRGVEDRTSPEYKAREHRQRTNATLFNDARDSWASWAQTPKKKLAYEVSVLTDNESVASLLLFHPFSNVLVFADDRDGIGVWDWMEAKKLNRFSNRNPLSTRVTSLLFANEHDNSQLVVGSNDGVVRVWRDFASGIPNSLRLSTAWRALPQIVPLGKQGSGLLLEWQDSGLLLTCGDANYVRLWDVSAEAAVQDIPTGSTHSVTAIAADRSDAGAGRLFVVGCGDGSVRVFDTRAAPRATCVATMCEHKSYVLGIGMTAPNRVVSASAASEIKMWDVGAPHPYLALTHEDMSAFAVHSRASLMASGSASQRIRVCSLSGEELNVIRYHEGFLGQRMAPVSSLALHPYRLLLAGGFTDSWISIYSPTALK